MSLKPLKNIKNQLSERPEVNTKHAHESIKAATSPAECQNATVTDKKK